MSPQDDVTTLVCLFHHQEKAQAAIRDLHSEGITQSAISTIGGPGTPQDAVERSELASLGMPDKDYDHLKQGVRDGGVVVAVSSKPSEESQVEKIFARHSAAKIDEVERRDDAQSVAAAAPVSPMTDRTIADEGEATVIPIVEESLVVGKRNVDRGGVRVYRRVVETPVSQDVSLHEEHVVVERHAVDRAVSDADLRAGDRTFELTETAEEAVVQKQARVVEEVLVGKASSDHTETVQGSVRRTEVEVEQLPDGELAPDTKRRDTQR